MLGTENEKEILDNNYYLNKKNDERNKKINTKRKKRIFKLGIIVGLIIIACLFFFDSSYNIFKINVLNNKYLTNQEVIASSGMSKNDKYPLTFNIIISKRLKSNPLIEDAYIEKVDGNIVNIYVTEKKIVGYYYDSEKAYLICSDDTRVELNKDNMHLINNVPLIVGYTSDELSTIVKEFDEVDSKTISEISEIHKSAISYDELRLEVIMNDSNYIYVGRYGIKMLNNYASIESALGLEDDKNYCMFFDETSNSGYTSKCPWEE